MNNKIVLCPLIIVFAGVTSHAFDPEKKGLNSEADQVTTLLMSLPTAKRKILASKLYYMNNGASAEDVRKTLLENLKNQGRVEVQNEGVSSPRTISSETGI